MAYDGLYLQKIKQELDNLVGQRLDKINQPSKETLVLTFRNQKLLIMAGGNVPKMHFTKTAVENPIAAPMFCMVLRKWLNGAKVTQVEQVGLDRILIITFRGKNELQDEVELKLVCEFMGRRSNVILINANNRIIDAIRRVDFVDSENRQILPNMIYQFPAPQNKTDIRGKDVEKIASEIFRNEYPLSSSLVKMLSGFSPVAAREISYKVTGTADTLACELDARQQKQLIEELKIIQKILEPEYVQPVGIFGNGNLGEKDEPLEYNSFPLTSYPENCPRITYESYSALLDAFYSEKDSLEGIRKEKNELLHMLESAKERIERKKNNRLEELGKSKNRETLRQYADILSANISQIGKGLTSIKLMNFYSPEEEMIEIPLDPKMNGARNAQRYYNEYRKQSAAHRLLNGLIEEAISEENYIKSVIEATKRSETNNDLLAIRRELVEQNIIRLPNEKKNVRMKLPNIPYLEYLSDDGFQILAGRNNLQNDQLTHKLASAGDVWLHVQKAPGSHVIIISKGKEIPESTINQAAIIAAVNSSENKSVKVPVDYILAKKVKKPTGSRPGFATYNGYQTAYIEPDEKLEKRLRKENRHQ